MGNRNSKNQESYRLIVNDKFFIDLQKILDYIAIEKQQPLNAFKVAKGINATLNQIILNPTIYSECKNLPTKSRIYREALYKTWQIIFKLKTDRIFILGIKSGKVKPASFRKIL